MSFFDYPEGGTGAPPPSPGFLANGSDGDWALIREHAELLHIRPGETVIAEGDLDDALYILVDGTLEATVVEGRRGRDRRIAKIEAGTVIGEVGFFGGGRRTAAVKATSDAKLLRLGRDSFEFLAAKEPALGRAILFDLGSALAGRLRAVEASHRGSS